MKAGRKSVDPGLREKLVERNHSLDDLFINKKIDVQERVKKSDSGEDDQTLTEDARFRYVERTGVYENLCSIIYQKLCKIFCTDIPKLVNDVCLERGLNADDVDVHLGFDGGQGSLKLVLSLTEKEANLSSGRSKYSQVLTEASIFPFIFKVSQGVSHKEAKTSSVKKVLILAVVPDVAESHHNVRSILQQVDFGTIQYIYAVDVKMGNIMPYFI